jgi:hypothetical protein
MCENVQKYKKIEKDSFQYNLKKLNDLITKGEKKLLKIKQYETT